MERRHDEVVMRRRCRSQVGVDESSRDETRRDEKRRAGETLGVINEFWDSQR